MNRNRRDTPPPSDSRMGADGGWAGPAFADQVDLRGGRLTDAVERLEALRDQGLISDLAFEFRKELLTVQLDRPAAFRGARPHGIALREAADLERHLLDIDRQRRENLISDIAYNVRKNLLIAEWERKLRTQSLSGRHFSPSPSPIPSAAQGPEGSRNPLTLGLMATRTRGRRLAAFGLLAALMTILASTRGEGMGIALTTAPQAPPPAASMLVSGAISPIPAPPTAAAPPPTSTAVPTPTGTPAPTETSTPAPTTQPTPTSTPTAMPTPSSTPSATPTASATPSASPTPSATPTATPTSTQTPTASPTPATTPTVATTPTAITTPSTTAPQSTGPPPNSHPPSPPSGRRHAAATGAWRSTAMPPPQSLADSLALATAHQPLLHFHPPASPVSTTPRPSSSSMPHDGNTPSSGRQIHAAGAKLARSALPRVSTLPLILLILAAIVLSATLIWLAMPAPTRARWRSRVAALPGPVRAKRLAAGGLLIVVALAFGGGPPRSISSGTAAAAPSRAPALRMITSDAASSTDQIGLNAFSSPANGALASVAEPLIWRDLVGIETVIEKGTSGGVRLTLVGVQGDAQRNAALIAEEALYKGAIKDPVNTAALTGAAARTRDAEVIAVVATDLNIVRTAAANTSVAAVVRATQSRIGSLSPAQVVAISSSKPLIRPMNGSITQPFGPSNLGIEPSRSSGGVWYPHFHSGLDIAEPQGTAVHAAADGVVRVAGASTDAAGNFVGYGQYIVIEHGDGFSTLYGHLLDLNVHSGDTVAQGQIIGHEGSTGNSTGPHLHFEVRVDGEPVDPLPYMP